MSIRGVLSAIGATCLFMIALMAREEPALAYVCELLIEQDPEVIKSLKAEAITNGGYVFAFRHSHKDASEGLSQCADKSCGIGRADLAAGYLAELWDADDRTPTVFEKSYGYPRIKQTRERIMRGFPPGLVNEESIGGLETWLRTRENFDLIPGDQANTFVFVNSTTINELNCPGGANCDFACLEGVAIKLNEDGEVDACYRFFPSEWANPVNAELPKWALKPRGTSCAGMGSDR